MTQIKQGKVISRAHLPPHIDDEWKAIDGKALRGALKSGEKEAIIHVVSHDSRTEVTQCRQSGEKSSEITVVRDLLEKQAWITLK